MLSRVVKPLSRMALVTLCVTAAHAQGTSAFDGNWIVTTVCQKAFDGAAGYTLRFNATVKNGVFHGENGVAGDAGYLAVDCTIAPDGSAMLRGQGLTGDPVYNVGHAGAAMPFYYHVKSQFSARQGTGTRVELRPCVNTYSKL